MLPRQLFPRHLMTLTQRLSLLAEHSALFTEFTGPFEEADLHRWLEQDLGSALSLGEPQANAPSFASVLSPNLVVLSGNTPHAAIQSLLRALILGAQTHFKRPRAGLPALDTALAGLPAELRVLTSVSEELPQDWQDSFEALVVYGSDETIAWFSQRVPPHMRFLKHGQRLAIGLVTGDPKAAASLAARDASLFNQQGCQSLHNIYLAPEAECTPQEFCPLLAEAMALFATTHPRAPLTLSESGAISNLRETTRYLAAVHPREHLLLESSGNTDWTVIYNDSPKIEPSCLNRVVYVKPWPRDLADLGPETRHLSALALHPWTGIPAPELLSLAPPRICPLGSCQNPPLHWHHDGIPSLASLVKWTDLE
jgi:hypothetical protein